MTSPLVAEMIRAINETFDELDLLRARLAYIKQAGCAWCRSVALGDKDAALVPVESERRSP